MSANSQNVSACGLTWKRLDVDETSLRVATTEIALKAGRTMTHADGTLHSASRPPPPFDARGVSAYHGFLTEKPADSLTYDFLNNLSVAITSSHIQSPKWFERAQINENNNRK